ncbi:MAG: hypothetical protein M3Y51_11190 [Actinomycetota bacterium]|nr:hypothetical protein [Actinomycetota bacterium]
MDAAAPDPVVGRPWWLPWIGVALLIAGSFASVWWATSTGATDGVLLNGDEAVAALLPTTFARSGVTVIFPGNAYQGVLEVPVYAVVQALGGGVLAMRLLHQGIWLGALVTWTAAVWTLLDDPDRPLGRAARGWVLLTVLGLAGVTSLVGWQVWFHLYPGYQSGALLAGLAVFVAARMQRSGRSRPILWVVAGALAGLAIYAQPMHVVGAVCLGVLALSSADRIRAVACSALGTAVGVAPWIWWNVVHDMAVLDARARPAQHPDWGYPDRLANTARITMDVLWGDGRIRSDVPTWVVVCQVVAATAMIAAVAVGVVALVRSWRRSAALIVGVVVMLLALPAMPTFSLDIDQRYAVGWWPALAVLVAAGSVRLAALRNPWRSLARGAVIAAVVCHVAAAVGLAAPAISTRRDTPAAVVTTSDLGGDLRRCGVDIVAGGYWAIYPASWGSDGDLDAAVIGDTQRLPRPSPRSWRVDAVAVLATPNGPPAETYAAEVSDRHGRGTSGWTRYVHRPTGVTVLLEEDVTPPDGCISRSGLTPSS